MLKTGHDLSAPEIRAGYERLPHLGGLGPAFLRRVLELAGDLTGVRVVELGCGRSDLLAEIAARWPTARLHGLDLSPGAAAHARGDGRAHVVVADLGVGAPFAGSSFERVFCLETLEHLKRPDGCLREIVRLLCPGGRAILSVPNASGFAPFHGLGRLLPGRWLRGKLLPYEHPAVTEQPIDTAFSFAEIVALVTDAGLTIEAMRGWRYFRYLEMLPGTRALYPGLGRVLERVMPKIDAVRFAYNLIIRCRVVGEPPARP